MNFFFKLCSSRRFFNWTCFFGWVISSSRVLRGFFMDRLIHLNSSMARSWQAIEETSQLSLMVLSRMSADLSKWNSIMGHSDCDGSAVLSDNLGSESDLDGSVSEPPSSVLGALPSASSSVACQVSPSVGHAASQTSFVDLPPSTSSFHVASQTVCTDPAIRSPRISLVGHASTSAAVLPDLFSVTGSHHPSPAAYLEVDCSSTSPPPLSPNSPNEGLVMIVHPGSSFVDSRPLPVPPLVPPEPRPSTSKVGLTPPVVPDAVIPPRRSLWRPRTSLNNAASSSSSSGASGAPESSKARLQRLSKIGTDQDPAFSSMISVPFKPGPITRGILWTCLREHRERVRMRQGSTEEKEALYRRAECECLMQVMSAADFRFFRGHLDAKAARRMQSGIWPKRSRPSAPAVVTGASGVGDPQ
ncbi:hypothetical protein CHUAL_011262 [Chamberlinius hualienensis]